MTATSTIEGYAARAVGQSLEPFTYEQPKLGNHDVRVSVSSLRRLSYRYTGYRRLFMG